MDNFVGFDIFETDDISKVLLEKVIINSPKSKTIATYIKNIVMSLVFVGDEYFPEMYKTAFTLGILTHCSNVELPKETIENYVDEKVEIPDLDKIYEVAEIKGVYNYLIANPKWVRELDLEIKTAVEYKKNILSSKNQAVENVYQEVNLVLGKVGEVLETVNEKVKDVDFEKLNEVVKSLPKLNEGDSIKAQDLVKLILNTKTKAKKN